MAASFFNYFLSPKTGLLGLELNVMSASHTQAIALFLHCAHHLLTRDHFRGRVLSNIFLKHYFLSSPSGILLLI